MKKIEQISDVTKELVQINQKLTTIRHLVESKSGIEYHSQDARHVALDGIQQNVVACGMWINGLLSLANEYSSTDSRDFREADFLNAVGSGLTLRITEDVMWNYLRLSLVVLVHFKIDSLFQNILKHIGRTPKNRGFWHLSDSILHASSIPVTGYEKDVLSALANIRNSLHNNGIHQTKSMSVKIKGLDFVFEEEEKIECASWLHSVIAISECVGVLEKILLSDEIKGISRCIILSVNS
jgi:hypothetical protein